MRDGASPEREPGMKRGARLFRRAGSIASRRGKHLPVGLTLAVVLAASACTSSSGGSSSGGSSSGGSSGGQSLSQVLEPVLTVPAPGLPPDIPGGPPACGGDTPQKGDISAAVANLVGACGGITSDGSYLGLFTNLSDAVLDVYPGSNASGASVSKPPTDLGLIPFTWDDAEIYAQTTAFSELSPPSGADLVPVGGAIYVEASTPVHVQVAVDEGATAESRAGQLVTDYVVDNLKRVIPPDSVAAYAESIASCVNAAYSLWGALNQDQAKYAAYTMFSALTAYQACRDLQDKLKSDPASDLHAAELVHPIGAAELDPDLSKVASIDGQDGWGSTVRGLLDDGGDVVLDLR
jgi:hypothetical protein